MGICARIRQCTVGFSAAVGALLVLAAPSLAAQHRHHGHRSARLVVAISKPPATIAQGTTVKLRVKVTNRGGRRTHGRVTVTVTAGRGLRLATGERRHRLRALAPRRSRTLSLKVTLTASSGRLKVSARAGRAHASGSRLLKATKAAPTPSNPLVGTYWWHFGADYSNGDQQDNSGFYFVNDNTVYSGLPSGGLPASCTAGPVNPSAAIDQQGACLGYTVDPSSGAVTIGGTAASGSESNGTLTVNGTGYQPLTIEPAGWVTNTNLEAIQTFGSCLFTCIISDSVFGLSSNGTFYLATSSSVTGGAPGPPWAPNQTGTYTVNAGGSITLHFDDGTVQTATFAVEGNDPVGQGVLLNALAYGPPSSG